MSAISELIERLEHALDELSKLKLACNLPDEYRRLAGKCEGVELALSYAREIRADRRRAVSDGPTVIEDVDGDALHRILSAVFAQLRNDELEQLAREPFIELGHHRKDR